MAKTKKAQKSDQVMQAAIEHFSSRSHDAWRRNFLKANPSEKGKPRMRLRGGVMVDINQPWAKLDPRAKEDNKRAARDAYAAVAKFPNDREAASDFVHKAWIKANKKDPNQPKELFKPYAQLPEVEKDKDRAHVDAMIEALAAVRKSPTRKAPRATKKLKAKTKTIKVAVDARAWAQLEASAKTLSKALGQEVSPEVLATAGIEVMTGVCRSLVAEARSKRS